MSAVSLALGRGIAGLCLDSAHAMAVPGKARATASPSHIAVKDDTLADKQVTQKPAGLPGLGFTSRQAPLFAHSGTSAFHSRPPP